MAQQSFSIKTWLSLLALACLLASGGIAVAQQSLASQKAPAEAHLPTGTPLSWAEDAARNELRVIETADTIPLRYRQRRVGAKGDTTREVIETQDGNIARLVERNGRPISPADDALERTRLMDDIRSPNDFLNHHRRDHDVRDSAMKLVAMMPQAMVYSYTPKQPQMKNVGGLQVVLDFHPNPAFHPPTMFSEALTGLEGSVWIDARSHYVTRIEAHVLRPVDMGFGLVAKIHPGGTVELEQTHIAGDQWVYSHVDEHLTVRLLMLKTMPENNVVTSWDFRPMPSLVSYQEGARMLLAMPLPVH
jgi:hypothetical protein